jgi:hypothetical protein
VSAQLRQRWRQHSSISAGSGSAAAVAQRIGSSGAASVERRRH